MTLETGKTYDVKGLKLTGWTASDEQTVGYHVADYFDGKNRYRGPDEYGIEPTFADEAVVRIPSAKYEDYDDCFEAAVDDYTAANPALEGYDLNPRWSDDNREYILLTVPMWKVAR